MAQNTKPVWFYSMILNSDTTQTANKPDAATRAIASKLNCGYPWGGVTDPECWRRMYARFTVALVIAVTLLTMAGCSSNSQRTRQKSVPSDFVIGHFYRLSQEVIVCSQTNLVLPLRGPISSIRPDLLIHSGTLFKVREIVTSDDPWSGHMTTVNAEVISGLHRGRTVNIRPITQHDRRTGQVTLDPKFLQPVEEL